MNGHDVAVEFNKALLVLNRARLYIDAEEVDCENVLYGDKEPGAALPDGTAGRRLDRIGNDRRTHEGPAPQPDGSWVDLEDRRPEDD